MLTDRYTETKGAILSILGNQTEPLDIENLIGELEKQVPNFKRLFPRKENLTAFIASSALRTQVTSCCVYDSVQKRTNVRYFSRTSPAAKKLNATGDKFVPSVDGLSAFADAVFQACNSSTKNSFVHFSDVKKLYKKRTGRALNADELNLIAGTKNEKRHVIFRRHLRHIVILLDVRNEVITMPLLSSFSRQYYEGINKLSETEFHEACKEIQSPDDSIEDSLDENVDPTADQVNEKAAETFNSSNNSHSIESSRYSSSFNTSAEESFLHGQSQAGNDTNTYTNLSEQLSQAKVDTSSPQAQRWVREVSALQRRLSAVNTFREASRSPDVRVAEANIEERSQVAQKRTSPEVIKEEPESEKEDIPAQFDVNHGAKHVKEIVSDFEHSPSKVESPVRVAMFSRQDAVDHDQYQHEQHHLELVVKPDLPVVNLAEAEGRAVAGREDSDVLPAKRTIPLFAPPSHTPPISEAAVPLPAKEKAVPSPQVSVKQSISSDDYAEVTHTPPPSDNASVDEAEAEITVFNDSNLDQTQTRHENSIASNIVDSTQNEIETLDLDTTQDLSRAMDFNMDEDETGPIGDVLSAPVKFQDEDELEYVQDALQNYVILRMQVLLEDEVFESIPLTGIVDLINDYIELPTDASETNVENWEQHGAEWARVGAFELRDGKLYPNEASKEIIRKNREKGIKHFDAEEVMAQITNNRSTNESPVDNEAENAAAVEDEKDEDEASVYEDEIVSFGADLEPIAPVRELNVVDDAGDFTASQPPGPRAYFSSTPRAKHPVHDKESSPDPALLAPTKELETVVLALSPEPTSAIGAETETEIAVPPSPILNVNLVNDESPSKKSRSSTDTVSVTIEPGAEARTVAVTVPEDADTTTATGDITAEDSEDIDTRGVVRRKLKCCTIL